MKRVALALFLIFGAVGAKAASAQAPANSHKAVEAPGWACDDGYLKRGVKCVSLSSATDNEVRSLIIAESIAAYSGSCPCPFNVDRAGRSCGQRSAYSRPGGQSPRCYESDVSDAEVNAFRAQFAPRPQ